MRNDKKTLEKLGEIALATIPVAGYYCGHSEGIKEGYENASECYKKKYNDLKQRMQQIKRDLLEDDELFIFPAGWDEEYWIKLMSEFLVEQEGKSLSAKDLLVCFITFCHDKFPQDKLAETRHQLEIVRGIIEMPPSSRLKVAPEDLELAVRFLDVFGSPRDINQSATPESMKGIFKELLKLRDEIKAAQDTSHGCNFLILGKTGTGKSSLLNYLIEEKHFDAGAGKPVTGKGLYEFQTVINNVKATVYDSWGLETGNSYEEWYDILNKEKQKHDLRQNITEWFHAVIYCIQAPGARIEDVDRDIINSFVEENYHVIVVLTKADLCSEEDENELRRVLLQDCPGLSVNSVIAVCAEKKEIRGSIHNPFGKDELKEAIFAGYIESIISRLPKRCIYLAKEVFRKFEEKISADIEKLSFLTGSEENNNWLRWKCESFLEEFNSETFPKIVKNEIQSCTTISRNLAQIIQYNKPIGGIPSSELWGEDAPWWEKAVKSITIVCLIPAAIGVFIWQCIRGRISEEDAAALKSALHTFNEDVCQQIDELEPELQKKIRDALTAPPKDSNTPQLS